MEKELRIAQDSQRAAYENGSFPEDLSSLALYKRDIGPYQPLGKEIEGFWFNQIGLGYLSALILDSTKPCSVVPLQELISFVRKDHAIEFLNTLKLSPLVQLITDTKPLKEGREKGVEFVTNVWLTKNAPEHLEDFIPMFAEFTQEAKAARNHLIGHHLRLVLPVANKLSSKRQGLELLDLIQSGNLGLMTAVTTYDIEMEHRFSTYATQRIRGAILRSIEDTGTTVRLHGEIRAYLEGERKLAQCLGQTPSLEELAEYLGTSTKKLRDIKDVYGRVFTTSIDAELSDPDDLESGSLEELVPDETGALPDPFEETWRKHISYAIRNALQALHPKDARIIQKRFGLGPYAITGPQTLKDVAASEGGITHQGVSYREQRTFESLRNNPLIQSLR